MHTEQKNDNNWSICDNISQVREANPPERRRQPYLLVRRLLVDHIRSMRAQVERQDAALQKKQKNESKIQLQRPPEREGYGGTFKHAYMVVYFICVIP